MNDDELTDDWQAGTLARSIGHEEHLRIARTLVRRHGREEATARLLEGTRLNSELLGVPERFDADLTRAWSERVADAMEAADGPHFSAFIDQHRELLRSDLLGEPEWRRDP